MSPPIVFQPEVNPRRRLLQMLAIAAAAFAFVEVVVLDDAVDRGVFAVLFPLFVLAGARLWIRHARAWPQAVRLDDYGIRCSTLARRYGVDAVPWTEITRMNLRYTNLVGAVSAAFLCIELRPGTFRDRVRRPRFSTLGVGGDIDIPLAVDAEPAAVLQAANDRWLRYGISRTDG